MADQRLSLIIEAVDHATKTLNKIEKETQGLSVVSAAAFLSIANTAVQATDKILEFGTAGLFAADQINDLSKSTGISTEMLSSLKLELDKSGSSIEDLANAGKVLTAKMADVQGGSEEAAVAFKTFGINVKNADGSLRNLDSILPEIADAVAKGRNETEKMAIAQEFLGKKAGDLVPFLAKGAAGFKEAMEKAKELGVVLTGEAAEGADRFADRMVNVKAQIGALSLRVGEALLPTLERTIDFWSKLTATVLNFLNVTKRQEVDSLAERIDKARFSTVGLAEAMSDATARIQGNLREVERLNKLEEHLPMVKKQMIQAMKRTGDARALDLINLLKVTDEMLRIEQEAANKREQIAEAKRGSDLKTGDLFGRLAKKRVEDENKAAFDIAMIQSGTLLTAQARLDAELAAIQAAVNKKVITESEGNIKIAAANEKFRQSEFQARQEQVAKMVTVGEKLTDIALAEEGKRGNMLKAMIKEQVREYIKTQIRMALGGVAAKGAEETGKAVIAAPLSFGTSLLAIPLIAGAILAAESVINAIPFAKGGMVTGGIPGRDSVPAMLMPGEAVLPKSLVDEVSNRGGVTDRNGGITIQVGRMDLFGDKRYIQLVADELSKAVQFGGATLKASKVIG